MDFPRLKTQLGWWSLTATTAVLVLLFGICQDVCNDVWVHALHGKIIVEQGRFPRFSDYSFVKGEDVPLNADFFPSVLFYWLLEAFGYPGLLLYKSLGIGLTVIFLLLWTREEGPAGPGGVLAPGPERREGPGGVPWALGFCAAFYFMATAHGRFMPRNDLMNMAFLAIYLFCLSRHRNHPEWRGVWAVPFLQVLWMQFHYLSCLGWFVVLAYATEGVWSQWRTRRTQGILSGYHRKMLFLALACFLASFINEATWRKVFLPFSVLAQSPDDRFLYATIEEFQSLLRSDWSPLWPGFFLPALGLLVLFMVRRRELRSYHLILFLSFLPAAVMFVRLLALYQLVVSGLVAIYLWQWLTQAIFLRRRTTAILKLAALGAISANLLLAGLLGRSHPLVLGDGNYLRRCTPQISPILKPVRAVEFLRAHEIHGNIYINYSDGGFVGYHLYPDSKIIIHSLSFWYSREHYYNWIKWTDLNTMSRAYGIDTAVLIHYEERELAMIVSLYESPEWKMVYLDETTAVYLKKSHPQFTSVPAVDLEHYPVTQGICSNYGYYWLGNVFLKLGYYSKAEKFYQKARELGVESSNVLNNLGKIAAMQGNMSQAVDYFAASVRLSPCRTSLDNLKRALKLVPATERNSEWYREGMRLLQDR